MKKTLFALFLGAASLGFAQQAAQLEEFDGSKLPSDWVFCGEDAPQVSYSMKNSLLSINGIENSPGCELFTRFSIPSGEVSRFEMGMGLAWRTWDYSVLTFSVKAEFTELFRVTIRKEDTVRPAACRLVLASGNAPAASGMIPLTGSYDLKVVKDADQIRILVGGKVCAQTRSELWQTPTGFSFRIGTNRTGAISPIVIDRFLYQAN